MNTLVEKEYRLCEDKSPRSYILKVGTKGNLLVFDEDKGHQRPIRHCKNERSIFIDEQSDHAVISAIIFSFGNFLAKAQEVTTKLFLDTHPDNVKNGGNIFEEINEETKAEESLEYEDLVVDLKGLVRAKQEEEDGMYDLQTLAASIEGSYAKIKKLTTPELRRIIYRAIDANAYAFLNDDGEPDLFNEEIKRKYLALRAIGDNIIKVSGDGRKLMWADTGNAITNVPAGVTPTDCLVEYLETDDGILLLDKIIKSI